MLSQSRNFVQSKGCKWSTSGWNEEWYVRGVLQGRLLSQHLHTKTEINPGKLAKLHTVHFILFMSVPRTILHAAQQTGFYNWQIILLNLPLKCVCHTPCRWPFEGCNVSEWHSVNKVVLTIYVCVSFYVKYKPCVAPRIVSIIDHFGIDNRMLRNSGLQSN